MRTHQFFILCLLLFLIGLGSCSKEEFTKPSVVKFEFKMNAGLNEGMFLKFEEGYFNFNAVGFDGERETGGDVFFLAPFDDPVKADLGKGITNQPVEFDVPQGIYQRIKIAFYMDEIKDEPKLRFNGIYNGVRWGNIPVRVDINYNEVIEINADPASGHNEIVLTRDMPSIAEITIDPVSMFVLINSRILESADITEIDGISTIVISENSNERLYNFLIGKVERSTSAVFR